MSQEQVLKTLANLGFDKVDAQIYVCLAKKGVQKASEICKALKLTKQQLYPSLKGLQSKGIVSSTIEHPARFSAIPFDKVLDMFIKAKMEETRSLQQSKAEILSNWQNLKLEDGASAKFTVIEGRAFIYSKIQQMIQETKKQVLAITAVPSLTQLDQRGIFDDSYDLPLKSKIQFRFLAELSEKNLHVMKTLLKENENVNLNVEGRNPDLGLTLFPQMLVRDEEEAIFFTKPRTETSIIEHDDVCLWTDCKTLVKAFTAIFEELWRNSTNIQNKIVEIETGKTTPKTCIIGDASIAEKKYNEALQSAKEEIIMTTSTQGFMDYLKQKSLIEKWAKNGISVKVMAPIIRENYEAAKQLSKFCEVKHIQYNYLGTTIIDGKQLFQFKMCSLDQGKFEPIARYDSVFFTNNFEYVEKMKHKLHNFWTNARDLSSVSLDPMFPPNERFLAKFPLNYFVDRNKTYGLFSLADVKPLGSITEKDVLNKIMNAQKALPQNLAKDISIVYGSVAWVIIHPPDYLKLPDMMIHVVKSEKQSSFGAGDSLTVFLWLETAKGYAYIPVATAMDNHKSHMISKRLWAGTPAEKNFHFLKKDEIQVQVHGNTLFAGWTVPIPLYPPHYNLPPACLLVEGYGEVKPGGVILLHSSGLKSEIERNCFEAFVTFIHPSSKYSGPGTDGLFFRDYIMTNTPPQERADSNRK